MDINILRYSEMSELSFLMYLLFNEIFQLVDQPCWARGLLLCKVVRMDILVLFLILEEMPSAFHH